MKTSIEVRATEVLRALVLLADSARLARGANGCAFRGYWQDPAHSSVADEVMIYLLNNELVREDIFIWITNAGHNVLKAEHDELIRWMREDMPKLPIMFDTLAPTD